MYLRIVAGRPISPRIWVRRGRHGRGKWTRAGALVGGERWDDTVFFASYFRPRDALKKRRLRQVLFRIVDGLFYAAVSEVSWKTHVTAFFSTMKSAVASRQAAK